MIVFQVGEESDRITQFAECDGIRVSRARGEPSMALARELIGMGYEPSEPLETRRGEMVSMRYPSLAVCSQSKW
jgi:hypothetical protein